MESMHRLTEVSIGLRFLVGGLLGIRSAGGEDSHDLVEKRVDHASDLVDCRWDTEFGLLVELDQGWSSFGD